uniref:Transcription repressor n=1 Tax=Cicer arietinum TaxID=3827 RepID=A0A1S2Y309_CICAR|nr:transcription repressor OFP15 [Cicer arietinum]
MKFLSLFKNTDGKNSSSLSWAWPSCNNQPKTLSFRANKNDVVSNNVLETSKSQSTEFAFEDSIETVIRGFRSDRLFFEPNETSSILNTKPNNSTGESEIVTASNSNIYSNTNGYGNGLLLAYENTLAVTTKSRNPYEDFKKSMAEMVEAHGVNDWETLGELLSWYLKINEKSNYDIIIDAFIDLVVGASPPCSESHHASLDSSPLSIHSWTTPCVSSYSSPL